MASISEIVSLMLQGQISKDDMLNAINEIPTKKDSTPRTREKQEIAATEQFLEEIENETRYDLPLQMNERENERAYDLPLQMKDLRTQSASLISTKVSFHNRQTNFQLKKQLFERKEAQKKKQREIDGWTFKPEINSRPIQRKQSEPVFNRLSRPTSEHAKRPNIFPDNSMDECTFQPQLSKNKKFENVQNRLSESPRQKQNFLNYSQDHTFQPTVKNPRRSMSDAWNYLQYDAFERLYAAQPQHKMQDKENEPSEIPTKSHSSHRRTQSGSTEISNCFADRPFFERQEIYEAYRQQKIQTTRANIAPDHNPTILDSSRRLAAKSKRRRESGKRCRSSEEIAPQNSFRPKITARARAMRPRTAEQMSNGDFHKAVLKRVQAQTQAQSMDLQYPFKPQISSRNYGNVSSVLNVSQNPESYIARLRKIDAKRQKSIEEKQNEKLLEELKEWTHAPEIRHAPGYVRRIARNMAAMRAEESPTKNRRPEWR